MITARGRGGGEGSSGGKEVEERWRERGRKVLVVQDERWRGRKAVRVVHRPSATRA